MGIHFDEYRCGQNPLPDGTGSSTIARTETVTPHLVQTRVGSRAVGVDAGVGIGPATAKQHFRQQVMVPLFVVLVLCAQACVVGSGCHSRGRVMRVFAGTGLIDVMEEMKVEFEGLHEDVRLEIHYAGTGTLRQQLVAGAQAEVLAVPDVYHLQVLRQEGYFADDNPVCLAANRLVLVVPSGSGLTPRSPRDLLDPAFVRIAVGDPVRMAAGSYTRRVFEFYGLEEVWDTRTIRCENVRQTLMYAAAGEVEAAFMFATDAATELEQVEVVWTAPVEVAGPIQLYIGELVGAREPELARLFVAFATGPQGQAILRANGFLPPGSP